MQDSVRDEFIKSYEKHRIEPDSLIDSLFKLYEDIGFFNIRLYVKIDTICGDTGTIKIRVITKRLPAIDRVILYGVGLPKSTLNTYFPFKNKVFRRTRVIESFMILENAGIIKKPRYYFIPTSRKGHFILKIHVKPYEESFNISIIKGLNQNISGVIDLSHPSLFSQGLGVAISLLMDNGKILHYDVKNTFVFPFIRGIIAKGEMSQVNDTIKIDEKKGEIALFNINHGVSLGAGKFNSAFLGALNIFYSKRKWRMGIEVEKKGGWILKQRIGFSDKLSVGVENGIVVPIEYHYLLMTKPLRIFKEYIPKRSLFYYFLLKTRIPFKMNLSFFMDFCNINGLYLFDTGVAYIKEDYGIYLGYSFDKSYGRLNIGFAIGVKNSVFERSISIL